MDLHRTWQDLSTNPHHPQDVQDWMSEHCRLGFEEVVDSTTLDPDGRTWTGRWEDKKTIKWEDLFGLPIP